MTEDQIRELFREMREEPVPADSRARVRVAVDERSRTWAERLRRHWKIAAAVLVPAFAVLVAMLAREPVRVPRPEANARPTAAEETAALTAMPAPEVSASHPRLAAHRAVRAVPRPSAERIADGNAAGVVIRIETPDPNVVILLVGG
jgi:hypothetical protein